MPNTNTGPPGWGFCVRPGSSPWKKILAKKSQQRRVAGLINGCGQRRVNGINRIYRKRQEEFENKELD
jgi:hypothetical protein